jgi:hypothetical protein
LTYSQKHAFIGFYSKRRKTNMQVIHLSQKELAERWRMSEATLERSLMASPNSPTSGHPKFPQAAPLDYDVSGVTTKRAAASLSL